MVVAKKQNDKEKLEVFNKRYEYAANILNGKVSLKEAVNWMSLFIRKNKKG